MVTLFMKTDKDLVRFHALFRAARKARKNSSASIAIALMLVCREILRQPGLGFLTLQKEADTEQRRTAARPNAAQDTIPSAACGSATSSRRRQNQSFTLPAGTKFRWDAAGRLSLKSKQTGSDVYLQLHFRAAGSQVLIPPGAYIQGVIPRQAIRNHEYCLSFNSPMPA